MLQGHKGGALNPARAKGYYVIKDNYRAGICERPQRMCGRFLGRRRGEGHPSRRNIMRYISEAGKSMVYPEGAGICCYQKEQTT